MATKNKTASAAKKSSSVNTSKGKKSGGKVVAKQNSGKSDKKPALKKTVAKNSKTSPAKLTKQPIKKSAPVKKAATPVAKKAATKKLSTPEKKISPSSANNIPKPEKKGLNAVANTDAKSAKNEKIEKSSSLKNNDNGKSDIKKSAGTLPQVTALPKAKDIKVPPAKPVVLPKITTTRSRKYEPEFTKSVLDQAPPENNGPSMRYSDPELNEFKELIQRKLETAKKELGYLQGLITRKDEMGGDDTDNRYMTMEDGSLSMEREQLSQMASRQITFIDHLEKAMMRIENKTYGICRVTGKLIDKARLRAVPHATLSIEAKMGVAK